MIWIARNANAFMPAWVSLVGASSVCRLRKLFCAHCGRSAGESARQRSWCWLTLVPALLACMPISLQAQSATAKLNVTATVVPSAYMIFLPDGSTKVIVANGHESGSAMNLYSRQESTASTKNAADQKSAAANAPAGSQGDKRKQSRMKP